MCWYTMLGVPDLATFGEPCDNHANCLDEYGVYNKDPRADDTKPYACALYSFCPDHCCPMKHIRYMKDCYQSQSNPCYAENRPVIFHQVLSPSGNGHLAPFTAVHFSSRPQSSRMSLREWYANRVVLLTGVNSELGRVLLEKILRCLPGVRVYVVLRSQNGLNAEERLKKIFASPGYERLRQEMPGAISRVKTFEGNLLYEDLALSAEDKAALREVTVAFHAAGPHDFFLEYCQDLPKLKSVAMASTIFKHRGKIEECLQNEKIPELPIALVRFPCIGPAYKEPMPGFVETLKAPTALMIGAGFALGNSELPAEVTPLDTAVNTMIAAAWEIGITNATKPVVYNAALLGCTWDNLIKKSQRAGCTFPYPTFGIRGMTSFEPLYWILVLLLEWLPSLLCDIVFGLIGRKQRILAEYDRVRNALQPLKSISTRPWPAERNRVYLLQERLTKEEQDVFPIVPEIDIESYVLCAAAATRKYCVNEDNIKSIRMIYLFFLSVPVILVVAYIASRTLLSRV
ncbi:fatty acyl-CoA reductase 1 [Temnothorax longispinosus]